MKANLAIFASGRGSNAQEIIKFFKENDSVDIKLIVSNKSSAGVLDLAEEHGIDTLILKRETFYKSLDLIQDLKENSITHIVLAGFLWMIPPYLIENFQDKIVNIHPALLPKYGGKGMYGHHVHQAVFDNKEKESGMTIHYVNANYDEGQIIFQATTKLDPTDQAEDIAAKVLVLEHKYYPEQIEIFVNKHFDQ